MEIPTYVCIYIYIISPRVSVLGLILHVGWLILNFRFTLMKSRFAFGRMRVKPHPKLPEMNHYEPTKERCKLQVHTCNIYLYV